MAVDAATFLTFSAIGNREDLSDKIYNIDPVETPFLSGIERVKTAATNHEWQTQALAAVSSVNSVLEGDDGTTDTATATARLGNIHQISDKVARVSGTQRAVEHAGRDDELDYQIMLKGRELKRDMETILLANRKKRLVLRPFPAQLVQCFRGSSPIRRRARTVLTRSRLMVRQPVPMARCAPSLKHCSRACCSRCGSTVAIPTPF